MLLVTSIFADSDSFESESAPFDSMNLEHQELMAISRELAALAPAATTDTDYSQYIYNLLIACMSTSDNASSTYVLPRISSYLSTIMSRVNTTNTRLNTINNNLVAWFDSGTNSYNMYELLLSLCEEMGVLTNTGPNLLTQLGNIASRLTDIYNADYSSLIYSDVSDINSAMSSIDSGISSIDTGISDINNNISSMKNLNWLNIGNYMGMTNSFTGSYLSAGNLPAGEYYVWFNTGYSDMRQAYYRFFIPFSYEYYNNNIQIVDIVDYYSPQPNTQYKHYNFIADYDFNRRGIWVYVRDFSVDSSSIRVVIKIKTNRTLSYTPSAAISPSYLPFDTFDYQILKMAFDIDRQSTYLEKLQKVLANDKKLAAEEASQEVIDDTLDGFTGSGSAAPSKSDTGSMKSISGDLKSGLNGGGSVSNATSVFSSNGGFWDWFTQSNYNNINNIPSNTRNIKKSKSNSNDDIIDFYSLNAEELQLLLDGE